MQQKVPSGMLAVTFFRLLARALWTVSFFLLPLRRVLGTAISRVPFEIIGGQAALGFQDLLERAFGHDGTAVDARAGAEVDHPVGGADRVLVMLDDDDGVAEVAQAAQRREQAVIVLLVQADAGFVEDIQHARQAGADLAGEADPLAFAAGQCP